MYDEEGNTQHCCNEVRLRMMEIKTAKQVMTHDDVVSLEWNQANQHCTFSVVGGARQTVLF